MTQSYESLSIPFVGLEEKKKIFLNNLFPTGSQLFAASISKEKLSMRRFALATRSSHS